MALKIPVVDRVPTYPGRVTLTPVPGQQNKYDLVRADLPIEEGTPINKALLDSKAYTLTAHATVYVAKTGSDTDGDGSSAAPFLTIQKAIDSLPKFFGGYNATISIGEGTYDERISIQGFCGGRLNIGEAGRIVLVRGISITNSSTVRLCITNIAYAEGFSGTCLYVGYGSNVTLAEPLYINAEGQDNYGVALEYGSILTAPNVTLSVNSCGKAAIICTLASVAALAVVDGQFNKSYGFSARYGSRISCAVRNLVGSLGDYEGEGSQIILPESMG